MKISRVLVTGGAGFIASKATEMLLADGVAVVVVDNLNDYYDIRLKAYRLRELATQTDADPAVIDALDPTKSDATHYNGPSRFEAGPLTFQQLDIENKDALKQLFREYEFDAVLNLAARAGVRYSMIDPDVYMTTNALGTLNVMDAMRETGCKKMVLASTSSLYAGQPMPFREDLPVNEPISPYAASKKSAEALAYSYHYLYDLDISVVRYFTVFGPAGRPDMSIFRFVKWIDEDTPIELFGDGTQSRDFTYVDDIARGSIAAMTKVGYEVINLGGGNNPISINEVIQFIEKALGKKALIDNKPFHKADMMETWANIDKAGELLGWKPVIPPFDGFQKSVDWYVENRAWLKDVRV